jgi:hypothetical protein
LVRDIYFAPVVDDGLKNSTLPETTAQVFGGMLEVLCILFKELFEHNNH